MNVTPTSGMWRQTLLSGDGNPAPAIQANSADGDTAIFEVTADAGLWNFAVLEMRSRLGDGTPTFLIEGLDAGGAVLYTESGDIAPFGWNSYGAGNLGTDIDTLRVTVNLGGATGINLDNISIIPAPGALAILAGAGLLVARRRR